MTTEEQKRKHREDMKKWIQKNPDKWKEITKRTYQKNHSHILLQQKKYREQHKEQQKKTWQNWYSRKENSDKVKARTKQWRKENPKRVLEQAITHIKKHCSKFNLDTYEYKYALQYWSDLVQKREKCCQVCGVNVDLESHHIIPKQMYPALQFNLLNGITLCHEHHWEIHRLNSMPKIIVKQNFVYEKPKRRLKTHCKNGHEFTPENTSYTPRQRNCRKCKLASTKRHQLKKKQELLQSKPQEIMVMVN